MTAVRDCRSADSALPAPSGVSPMWTALFIAALVAFVVLNLAALLIDGERA
jgi:hypothetical protein